MSELLFAEYLPAGASIPTPYARIGYEDDPVKEQVKDIADRLAIFLSEHNMGPQNLKEQQEVEEVDISTKVQKDGTKIKPDPLEALYIIQTKATTNINYRVVKCKFSGERGLVHIFTSSTCRYDIGTLEAFVDSIKPKERILP